MCLNGRLHHKNCINLAATGPFKVRTSDNNIDNPNKAYLDSTGLLIFASNQLIHHMPGWTLAFWPLAYQQIAPSPSSTVERMWPCTTWTVSLMALASHLCVGECPQRVEPKSTCTCCWTGGALGLIGWRTQLEHGVLCSLAKVFIRTIEYRFYMILYIDL